MSLFVIETKELKSVKDGWKVIAENHVVARNVAEALEIVEKWFTKDQYIHKAISELEFTLECKTRRYFF